MSRLLGGIKKRRKKLGIDFTVERDGRESFAESKSRLDNPYGPPLPGTKGRAHAWERGWLRARTEHMKRKL